MIFIQMCKYEKKPTKEIVAEANRIIEGASKEGVKFLASYWTLGKYDVVHIIEAPDEKTAMKLSIRVRDLVSAETLLAVSREEATKLVE